MSSDRVQFLEEAMGISIIDPVRKGESLEKYKISVDGQLAMLRLYGDEYYGNRFLREGLALRYLTEKSTNFTVPQICEEWPEYNARAIEWLDISPLSSSFDITPVLTEFKQLGDYRCPFSLVKDLKIHLLATGKLHSAYADMFAEYVNLIFGAVDFGAHEQVIVHGDFHRGNIGTVDDQLLIFDWEYASRGSSSYDAAYYDMSIFREVPRDPTAWDALVIAVFTHWYLIEDQFSPKLALSWFEKLKKVCDLIS